MASTGWAVSNNDSFINEVTDEVRRDKLFALMRRYGWIAILCVIVLVGGAAFNEWRKASARAEAEATGDGLVSALEGATAEARLEGLTAIPESGVPGQRALQELLKAATFVETGDNAKAISVLDGLAGDTTVPDIYRDLALLKSVILSTGAASPEDRIVRLQPLMQPGKPFRLLALEQRALAETELGDKEAALETLKGIAADADGTEDLRRRATQLIVALGGTPDQG